MNGDVFVVAGDGARYANQDQYAAFLRLRDITIIAVRDHCPVNHTSREACGYCERNEPRHGVLGLQNLVHELETLQRQYPNGCALFRIQSITEALQNIRARLTQLPPLVVPGLCRRNSLWRSS